MEAFASFIPMDRRFAILAGRPLPGRTSGTALFADISHFTPITDALAQELGAQRGAEELTLLLNRFFTALIAVVHRYHGSVIGFSGDAVTCWFDGDAGPRAVASALTIQSAVAPFAAQTTPSGVPIPLALKVAIVAGPARRFVAGDPQLQQIDIVAGRTLDRLAVLEQMARPGEVLAAADDFPHLEQFAVISGERTGAETGLRAVQISGLAGSIPQDPWPDMPPGALSPEHTRSWVLPPVLHHLEAGAGQFLAGLRPAASLFIAFGGIDYDADDRAGELLDRYVRHVQQVIDRFGGSLLQVTMGDKGSYFQASFGAPVAHAEDASHAVAAALELLPLPPGLSFIRDVRCGVARGQMYAGTYGSPVCQTYGVLGDKTNLAARLMQAAGPGEILCDDEVYRLAQARWTFQMLPPIRVKGKAGLVRVYRPAGIAAGPAVQEPAEIVGRAEEITRVESVLQALGSGKGQVLWIEGEAGIGKTRLVVELVRRMRAMGLSGLRGTGESIGQGIPYRAWQGIFTSYFDIDHVEDPEGRRERVSAVIEEIALELSPRLPLLNPVLGLDLPDTPLTAGLDPSVRRESLVDLLISLLRLWLEERPLVLVLEDAHWLDSLSWELAVQAARSLLSAELPLLLVVVSRPLDESPSGDLPPADLPAVRLRDMQWTEVLPLSGLSSSDLEALVTARLGLSPGTLPAALVGLVQSRAGGNPFFAEELVYNLRERGLIRLDELDRLVLHPDLEQVEAILPDTLQGLILARIDRLPPQQQFTLKVAAVIGRTFAYSPLYATLSRFDLPAAQALQAHLQELVQGDFAHVAASEPELAYIFKHIISQETAYQTLLFSQRKELHRAVAEWYEDWIAAEGEKTAGVLAASLSLLAYHYHRAEDLEKERHYAWLFGRQAAAQYANVEAVASFSRALELTPPDDLSGRYEVLFARQKVYGLQGALEAQQQDLIILDRLAEELDDNRCRVDVLLTQSKVSSARSDLAVADSAARLAVSLARLEGDPQREAEALIALGRVLWKQGSLAEARQSQERALDLSRATGRRDLESDALATLGIVADLSGDRNLSRSFFEGSLEIQRKAGDRHRESVALNNLGVIHWRLGDYTQAKANFEAALQIDRELGNRSVEGIPLGNLALISQTLADYPRAQKYAAQALQLARELGDRYTETRTLGILGMVSLDLGDYHQAQDYFEQELRIDRQFSDRQDEVNALHNLGLSSTLTGDLTQAHAYLTESLSLSREIGDRDSEMLTERDFALLFHNQGDQEIAAEHARRSLDLAREIGGPREQAAALTFLGHAHLTLGRLVESGEAYRQAVELLQTAPEKRSPVEPQAGLARVSLAQGDIPAASEQVEAVLAYLSTAGPAGIANPAWVYLTCCRVLNAAGSPRFSEVLQQACAWLEAHAAAYTGERREMFLRNVPAHRELAAICAQAGLPGPDSHPVLEG